MKKKLLGNIFGVVAFIITILILFVFSYESKGFKIIAEKDSEAYKFAKGNNIEIEELADSEKEYYKEVSEKFSYNIYENGIEISKYDGVSKKLIIPSIIDDKIVLSIKDGVFKNNKNINEVVLAPTIKNINEDDYKDIKISCFNTTYCKKLKDDGLDVKILNDSDKFRVYYPDLDYEYNINDKIEITKYKGKSNNLIIPESINGKEVNSINLKITNNIKSIYIPSTVERISFEYTNSKYNTLFWFIIIIDLVALILFMAINHFAIVKNSVSENFYNSPIIIISTIYLLGTYIYSILSNIYQYDSKTVIIVLSSISIVYVLLSIILLLSKNKTKKYDEKIKNIDNYIKSTLNLLEDKDLEEYSDPVVKEIEEVKELIKYSDPVSSEETVSLEKEIKNLIEHDKDSVEHWKGIEKLIKKRNNICKNNK